MMMMIMMMMRVIMMIMMVMVMMMRRRRKVIMLSSETLQRYVVRDPAEICRQRPCRNVLSAQTLQICCQ